MNTDSYRVITEYLISKLPHLKLIYLFGSQVNNTATSHSDIDIAVLCDGSLEPLKLWEFSQQLAIKFNRDVDLIDLASCSTVLAMQVIQNGVLLFGSDADDLKFNLKTMSMYQHFQEERKEIVDSFYSGKKE